MRLAIRNQLVTEVTDLKECYEPNIPNRQTKKPYSVVVAKDDINLSTNENNVPIIPGTKRPLK